MADKLNCEFFPFCFSCERCRDNNVKTGNSSLEMKVRMGYIGKA